MEPRHFLRAEGFSVLAGSLAVYFGVDGPLWLLLALALAPDLTMLGYLRGPRTGSLVYNVGHTYVLPLALGGIGFWSGNALAVQVAAIWAGHIGADRLAGYGLKYVTGFKDTHLRAQPALLPALTEATGQTDER